MALDHALHLKNFTFSELLCSDGLHRLDGVFQQQLKDNHPDLHEKLLAYRDETPSKSDIETSELLMSCAIFLERFLANFFNIEEALALSQAKTTSHNPISTFKKYFVLRRARKELSKASSFSSFSELQVWLTSALKKAPLLSDDKELAVALLGTHYLSQPDTYAQEIETLVQWCTQALLTPEGQNIISHWVSFRFPERLDYEHLVPTITDPHDPLHRLKVPESDWHLRDGFKLTDPRMSARAVQDEVNYCIYCHDHDGDFCSKGFPAKKGDPAQGFKKNPLDITLIGCPLEEKISEMHLLKKEGHTLASLAMIMIDNPLCPATGHRICNDCMKACVYQKQDPVNIPQIETRVLTDVLDLPWGVEIYDLLTRWHPLRSQQYAMKPYNGLKIMIAGMGPAGFTLAHHLLLEGFAIVGFDGLKIEPLPERLLQQPIYRFDDLKESLDERLMAGFGGVAEYGITVRWDKNFLKLIYLSLLRKPHFQVFGSARFGGTITVDDAWEMGFDHFVVAVGAGLPKALPIPGSMAPGMRQANDFLMALQLGNAAKSSSLTSLQIRLPAVVIGGGLTGVDTATELQAYYVTQVEKISKRYQVLTQKHGETFLHDQLDPASREILAEYLRHAQAIHDERDRAKKKNESPNFIKLLQAWGGVTIAYRRSLQESPAYIHNHEELMKAFEEGIYYLEGLEPASVQLDNHGHTESLMCRKRIRQPNKEWITINEEIRLPARSILVATGTQPNTAYEFEYRGTFNRLNLQYQHYEDRHGELQIAHGVPHCKDPDFGPLTSYQKNHYRVSLIGDTHPVFHGSVVKAIASGKQTYPKIMTLLKNKLSPLGDENDYRQFAKRMTDLFSATLMAVTRKTNDIIELRIRAPLAAKHFKPGEFYRLQNFETGALHLHGTLLQMEPLALVAAGCKNDILIFMVSKQSASAKLCTLLKPGDPVSLMGPTGVRAKIPTGHETLLIIGQQMSFPFVQCYGTKLRAAGNRVIFLAELAEKKDMYDQSELENAADVIIWLTQTGDRIHPHRTQDYAEQGNDVSATLLRYSQGKMQGQPPHLLLADVDRIFVVGDTPLLRQFKTALRTSLKDCFINDPKVFASVYGNMQCMLKGVCAQCLQWQIDPETEQRTKAVFACSWQDQPLELIDIDHIDARREQNHLLDQLSALWVDHVLATEAVPQVLYNDKNT